MHFFVDVDSGTSISGWLVPDNPRNEPEFILRIPGREDVRMPANVMRADLRDIGLHATGLAGFRVDQEIIPDLLHVQDVTLIEAETRLPIYRRFVPGQYFDKKFLLLDIGVLPQVKMLRRIMAQFALSYPLIERLPIETIGMVLNNKEASSIFVTGALNWMRHGAIVNEREYVSAALLRDPFEDLAERILFLRHLSNRGEGSESRNTFLGATSGLYREVIQIIRQVDLSSPKSVLGGFRRMPTECRKLFRSPATAALGGTPDAELQRRNVSIALDNLAQFNVVGVRPLFSEFTSMVDECLMAPVLAQEQLEILPGTLELAEILSKVGLVADLLDEDIALYSFATEAVEAGLKIAADRLENETNYDFPEAPL